MGVDLELVVLVLQVHVPVLELFQARVQSRIGFLGGFEFFLQALVLLSLISGDPRKVVLLSLKKMNQKMN